MAYSKTIPTKIEADSVDKALRALGYVYEEMVKVITDEQSIPNLNRHYILFERRTTTGTHYAVYVSTVQEIHRPIVVKIKGQYFYLKSI
jgi:hypothetical protein